MLYEMEVYPGQRLSETQGEEMSEYDADAPEPEIGMKMGGM